MAARHNERDGFMFVNTTIINPYDEIIITNIFDQQVDDDIKDYEQRKKEIRFIKKACLIKLILTPIQYPLTYFLLGKVLARDVLYCSKLYLIFLRNKLTLEQFKDKLANSLDTINL